jgi:hypothetical protein
LREEPWESGWFARRVQDILIVMDEASSFEQACAQDAFPCPVCGYDLRVQIAEGRRQGTQESRCCECGAAISHHQLSDNVRLLCEGRTPLLAFFLVPVDLIRLSFPRRRLTKREPSPWQAARAARVLTVGVPLWLLSAALLCIFVSILARVTFIPTCVPTRDPPFTVDAATAVGDFSLNHPCALVGIALFTSAFAVAALVLMFLLRRQHPIRTEGVVQQMSAHAIRRTAYAMSPVFCCLILGATVTLGVLTWQSIGGDSWASEGSLVPFFLWLFLPFFLLRLARAGYADGGRDGSAHYVLCGVLAVAAWFVWIMLLGELLLGKNVGNIFHALYLRW